jgi:molecular chaperone GrpE
VLRFAASRGKAALEFTKRNGTRMSDPAKDPGAGHSPGEDGPVVGRAAGEERIGAAEEAPPTPRTLPDAMQIIAALREQLAARDEDLAQASDRFLRERADLENFKRRSQRERAEAARYANEPLLRELLPVIDNLERALRAAAPAEGTDRAAIASGVEMVLKQFAEILGRFGVSRVASEREPFDPSHHEALALVETHEHPAGTILEEHAAGYRLHDRLLRAAQVTVAKTPGNGAGK